MITELDLTGTIAVPRGNRVVTQQSLNAILQRHSDWVNGEPQGARAELSFMNLNGLDFSGYNLDGAGFYESEMSDCNFQRCSLIGANFAKARCGGSDFAGAILRGAIFSYAHLAGCNFYEADLRNAQGNRAEIKSVHVVPSWPITYTSHMVFVGCLKLTYQQLADDYLGIEDLSALRAMYGPDVDEPMLRHVLQVIVLDSNSCDAVPCRNENTYPLPEEE